MSIIDNLKLDLRESMINWKIALLFIPVAFLTYLFHEFGHWSFGEILGNKMVLSLNNATTLNSDYIHTSDELYTSMGGPAFTILQGIIFFIITKKTKSEYSFSPLIFATFTRFFSIIFGGLNLQDEARIANILNINPYLIAIPELLILALLVVRSSHLLGFGIKNIGYYIVLCTLNILIVIGYNQLFFN